MSIIDMTITYITSHFSIIQDPLTYTTNKIVHRFKFNKHSL